MTIKKRIAIAILSAGASSRLGKPKQLLQLVNGKTLLENTLDIATNVSGIANVILITGACHTELKPIWKSYNIAVVNNKDWHHGMSSSIISAVQFAEKIDIEGLILLVTDQPYLSDRQLQKLMEAINKNPERIIISKYRKGAGPPSYFPASYFLALKTLTGDQGAKPIIREHQDIVHYVGFDKGYLDLDTQENYRVYLESEE